jgi:signal transduction histidine kinase
MAMAARLKAPRRAVPLAWLLLFSHAVVFALPLSWLIGTGALAADQGRQREKELVREAHLVEAVLRAEAGDALGDSARWAELDPLCKRIFDRTGVGVRLVDRDRVVRATNGPRSGEPLDSRPELEAALAGEIGRDTRNGVYPSRERKDVRTDRRWSFAAIPVEQGGEVVGALVTIHANRDGTELAQDLGDELGAVGVLGILFTLAGASWFGFRLSRSVRALARVADSVEHGAREAPTLADIRRTRIAEVRLVASAFADMLDRLQARIRYNQEFAANVSHEFKTPLTTLRGTVDLLEDPDLPPEQRARFLANARTDLDRLVRMVQGLLALARADADGPRQPVDLGALASQVVARFPGVTVRAALSPVLGDASQLESAVQNLLENARQHGGPGVEVIVRAHGDRAIVEVVDDGAGVSPANVARVFDRFFTTSADREGSGLGLSLVRAVARAHGGEAWFRSAPGRTVASMWVPLAGGSDRASCQTRGPDGLP